MKKKLFDVILSVEIETLPGGEYRVKTVLPLDAPTVRQLEGLPMAVMKRAVDTVVDHLAVLYYAAQQLAFEESLGQGTQPDLSNLGGRAKPSAN